MECSTQSGNIQWTDKELGRGAYGKVHVGRYKNEKVAVKIIPLDFVDNCDNEIELQKNFDHPNVLKLLEVETYVQNGLRYSSQVESMASSILHLINLNNFFIKI